MRNLGVTIFLAGSFVLAGCGKEQSSSPSPNSGAGQGGGYLGTLGRSEQSAVKTIDTTSLNHEIQLFNAQEGRWPADLNELVTMHYIGKLPAPPPGMKINYDASQGKVTVVPQ
jgi:hypothetical protein